MGTCISIIITSIFTTFSTFLRAIGMNSCFFFCLYSFFGGLCAEMFGQFWCKLKPFLGQSKRARGDFGTDFFCGFFCVFVGLCADMLGAFWGCVVSCAFFFVFCAASALLFVFFLGG